MKMENRMSNTSDSKSEKTNHDYAKAMESLFWLALQKAKEIREKYPAPKTVENPSKSKSQ
jgi:hypothetical protein